MSGYCDCACRDCFEIAIAGSRPLDALCWACDEAGCDRSRQSECERELDDDEEAAHV